MDAAIDRTECLKTIWCWMLGTASLGACRRTMSIDCPSPYGHARPTVTRAYRCAARHRGGNAVRRNRRSGWLGAADPRTGDPYCSPVMLTGAIGSSSPAFLACPGRRSPASRVPRNRGATTAGTSSARLRSTEYCGRTHRARRCLRRDPSATLPSGPQWCCTSVARDRSEPSGRAEILSFSTTNGPELRACEGSAPGRGSPPENYTFSSVLAEGTK